MLPNPFQKASRSLVNNLQFSETTVTAVCRHLEKSDTSEDVVSEFLYFLHMPIYHVSPSSRGPWPLSPAVSTDGSWGRHRRRSVRSVRGWARPQKSRAVIPPPPTTAILCAGASRWLHVTGSADRLKVMRWGSPAPLQPHFHWQISICTGRRGVNPPVRLVRAGAPARTSRALVRAHVVLDLLSPLFPETIW